MKRLYKIASTVIVGFVFLAVISWAIMQKPLEAEEPDYPAGYYQPAPFQGTT